MGKRYSQSGVMQARAVMHDLATSPHTARHIAVKLARHFVADDPPPALVASWSAPSTARTATSTEVAEGPDRSPGGLGSRGPEVQDAVRIHGLLAGAPPTSRPDALPQIGAGAERHGPEAVQRPLAQGLARGRRRPGARPTPSSSAWPGRRRLAAQALDGRDPSQLAADALGARLTPARRQDHRSGPKPARRAWRSC